MRFHRIVRPTLPGVSVAPITATFRGEKKTFSGELFCSTALRADLPVLVACIVIYTRFGVKRSPVQTVDHITGIEPVFPRHRFNVALVAGMAEPEFLENPHGGRMLLLYIANEHISTNQPIESKHSC